MKPKNRAEVLRVVELGLECHVVCENEAGILAKDYHRLDDEETVEFIKAHNDEIEFVAKNVVGIMARKTQMYYHVG